MPSIRILLSPTLLLFTALPAFAYNHAHRGPTSPNLLKKHSSKTIHAKPTGPRAIDSERATEIQAALIKNGYMSGTPSGHWDAESQAAMQRLQGAQGWQTKLTPDSRALILLGLGPNSSSPNSLTSSVAAESPKAETSFSSANAPLVSTFGSQQ
jgi:hypothetical protein